MKEQKKRGRPVKWTATIIEELKIKLEEYTDGTDIPILADFCTKNKVLKQRLYEIPELSDSIKMLIQKKEANLELGCLTNAINPTMAIFSLKQLGWSDKIEQKTEHSGPDGGPIDNLIQIEFVNPPGK
jgi:FMN phosphatase YigB (HAD superfamily)